MSDTVPDMEEARRKLAADYSTLLTLIRTELSLALEPLREDIRELKSTSYSKDVLDEKFKESDRRTTALEQGWATLLTRGAAIVALIWSVISLLRMMHF